MLYSGKRSNIFIKSLISLIAFTTILTVVFAYTSTNGLCEQINNISRSNEDIFCTKIDGYDLKLMSELGGQEPSKQGILYVSLEKRIIYYKVLGKDKNVSKGEITADDLGNVAMPTSNDLSQYKLIKGDILEITSKRGHTQKDCFFPEKSLDNKDIIIDNQINWNSDKNLVLHTRGSIIFREGGKIISEGSGSVVLKAGVEPGDKDIYDATVRFEGSSSQIEMRGKGEIIIYYNPTTIGSEEKHKYHNPTYYGQNVIPNDVLISYMLVNDVYDLQAISALLHGNYALSQNIDASPTREWKDSDGSLRGFYPIMGMTDKTPFSGMFDGQDYVIDGLFINRPDDTNVGLFGDVTGINKYKSIIKNFVLINSDITGKRCVGGVVGQATGIVLENISVPATRNKIFSVVDSKNIEKDVKGYIAGCVFYNTHKNITKEEDRKVIEDDKTLFGSCVACNDNDIGDNKSDKEDKREKK